MRQIILASQSKARALLLSSLGIPFKAIPANIDEKKIVDSNLARRAQNLADLKAEKIITEFPNDIVISCDTYSDLDGKAFEKPSTPKEAREMLKELSGKKVINYTGFCYIDRKYNINFHRTVKVKYKFRELFEQEIKEYVKLYPVTQWAAGFALVAPYMTSFISHVSGSYTGLSYGLPTELLIPLLKKSGFEPNPIRDMVQ
jgi:MAF protein